MTRADRVLAAGLLALTGLLTGCSGTADGAGTHASAGPTALSAPSTEPSPSTTPLRGISSYVALGDSFTAAPFVPTTSFADGCFRSSGNYPALVADALGTRLRDVSCSGAETADVTAPQVVGTADRHGKVPPQLDAVHRGTDLVTVGIGGNDEQLFAFLVQQCTGVADQPGSPCADLLTSTYGDPERGFDKIGRRVSRVLRAVMGKAPEAQVLLVGYPRLVDASRPCPAMPLAAGDVGLVVSLETRLNRTLAHAARTAGATFVDMRRISRGHEICSRDPWVNGKDTDEQRALAFHPFAEGQQAVAAQVLAALS